MITPMEAEENGCRLSPSAYVSEEYDLEIGVTDLDLEVLMNNPVPVSLLSGDRKPQIRFLGNHHSGSGNLYHKSFRM